MESDTCKEHSGCITDIANLKEDVLRHEKDIKTVNTKVDSKSEKIMSRLNVVLGGVVVSCIMLVIDIAIRTAK